MSYHLIVCGTKYSILSNTLFNLVSTLKTDNVSVEFVDIEENIDIVYKYTIRSSPILLVFKDGVLWKNMQLPINKENILA